MASEAYWKESAIEIAKGLCEYTGIKYIERVTIPTKTITVNSTPQVINWLQAHLNAIVGGVYQLELTGIYDNRTRIAVLILWESIGWNKEGKDDGWKVGIKTINRIT